MERDERVFQIKIKNFKNMFLLPQAWECPITVLMRLTCNINERAL